MNLHFNHKYMLGFFWRTYSTFSCSGEKEEFKCNLNASKNSFCFLLLLKNHLFRNRKHSQTINLTILYSHVKKTQHKNRLFHVFNVLLSVKATNSY